MKRMQFGLGWVDVLVLVGSILLVLWVGFRASSKTHSVEAFLLGDRNLPWWAILGSIVATETSTATVLSVPAQGFDPSGMRFLQLAFGLVVGRLIVVVVLLPLFFQGRLSSAYEVLERRFGGRAKRTASLLFLISRNLGDGLRLYLAALVLQQLLAWNFAACAIAIGLVTICYTYFGGMRSIVWNDCIQLVIYMLGGIATVFLIGYLAPGGWQGIGEFLRTSSRSEIFVWRPAEEASISAFLRWLVSEPLTFWAGLVGGCFLTLGTHGTDQMMVQRYLSARSQRQAGWAIVLSGLVVLFQFALFLFIGVQLAYFYSLRGQGAFANPDDVYIHFMIHWFPSNVGLLGLMLAAIFAAAMSTLSSSLNASASAVIHDFYLPRQTGPHDSARLFRLTRRITVGFGLLQILIALWATRLESTVVSNALTIAGYAAGILLGLFAIALFCPRATQSQAIASAAVGFIVLLACQFGVPWLTATRDGSPGLRIAWTWYAAIGVASTYACGWLVSHAAPRRAAPPHG
jgi:SSS family transporter